MDICSSGWKKKKKRKEKEKKEIRDKGTRWSVGRNRIEAMFSASCWKTGATRVVKHHIGIGQLADFCGNRRIFPVLNRSTFLITRAIFTDAGTHLPSQLVSHENRSATLFSNHPFFWSRFRDLAIFPRMRQPISPVARTDASIPSLPYENSKRVNNSFPSSLRRIFRQNSNTYIL